MANYHPSPSAWVRDQVALIDANGTTDGVTIMDRPVVLLTMTGRKSGNILKVPLMRVEHDGICVAVASKGGAPDHPQWYYNLLAHPDITLQDGAHVHAVRARELTGSEREVWWPRCVAAYPPYADYQDKTDRLIPLFALEPR